MNRFALLAALASSLAAGCGPDSATGDCTDNLLPGDLVITEVFADSKAPPGGSGTDDGKEWFELYNNTDRPVELKGMTLTHSRPDGSRSKSHTVKAVTIAPGQYFTLGNSAADLLPAYIDYGYGADLGAFFNTDGGKVRVACGSTEIDSAIYESVKEGRSRQLSMAQPPDYQLNDIATNWCEAADTEFEPSNFGTPGSENDCTPIVVGQCSDGGVMRDAMPPMVGDLVITEVMPRPRSPLGADNQWFEVLALVDVDLNGIGLDRANDNNVPPKVINSAECIHVAAGEYVVFSRSQGVAPGGPTPVGNFDFTLNPTNGVTPDVQLVYNGTVIDAVTWMSPTNGASKSLDPDFMTATGNDSPDSFCDGVGAYDGGMNLGTPGAANPQCATVAPAGMCEDNGTLRAIEKPTAGQLVITEFLANPAPPPLVDGTGDADKEWFEVMNTGSTRFDLNDLLIANGSATPTFAKVQASRCLSIAPNGFGLFARSAEAMRNAGLPAPDALFRFSLTDSGQNAGIQIFDDTTLLDAVKWPTPQSAVSQGKALGLDPDHLNTTDNDTVNTAAITAKIYCLAVATYGDNTNTGTPRAANPQCP